MQTIEQQKILFRLYSTHENESITSQTRVRVEIHINSLLERELAQLSAKDFRNPVDYVKKSIRALKVLDYNINSFSDALVLNTVLQKLDEDNHENYDVTKSSNEVSKLDNFILFLEKRSQILISIKLFL